MATVASLLEDGCWCVREAAVTRLAEVGLGSEQAVAVAMARQWSKNRAARAVAAEA
jgi:hypothetical protein